MVAAIQESSSFVVALRFSPPAAASAAKKWKQKTLAADQERAGNALDPSRTHAHTHISIGFLLSAEFEVGIGIGIGIGIEF